MDNLKKYNEIFKEVFAVDDSALNEHLTKEEFQEWDSIHQLNLITYIEDTFDIMLDGDDSLGLTSYNEGMNILSSKYSIQF